MSVRQSLLAILDQGPCYGSQLRAEYIRRTGVSVNVGQVYTTLERLERDGLVENGGVDDDGRVLWSVTPAGRVEAHAWLWSASVADGRDEVALRIGLALTLPGADVRGILAAQRAGVRAALGEEGRRPAGEEVVGVAVVAAARRARLEAELRWLDEVERMATGSAGIAISEERPRRGRPGRASL